MERQEQQTKQIQKPTASEDQTQVTTTEADHEEPVTPTPLQRFRAYLDSAQRSQNPVASRRELGRDKSKSLFVLVGASVALLLLFFGVFSSPKNRGPLPGETAREWGRPITMDAAVEQRVSALVSQILHTAELPSGKPRS